MAGWTGLHRHPFQRGHIAGAKFASDSDVRPTRGSERKLFGKGTASRPKERPGRPWGEQTPLTGILCSRRGESCVVWPCGECLTARGVRGFADRGPSKRRSRAGSGEIPHKRVRGPTESGAIDWVEVWAIWGGSPDRLERARVVGELDVPLANSSFPEARSQCRAKRRMRWRVSINDVKSEDRSKSVDSGEHVTEFSGDGWESRTSGPWVSPPAGRDGMTLPDYLLYLHVSQCNYRFSTRQLTRLELPSGIVIRGSRTPGGHI